MESIRNKRKSLGMSIDSLASASRLSPKIIQGLESGEIDPKLVMLEQVATSLGYPPEIISRAVARIFDLPVNSVAIVSAGMVLAGESWKIWLFNFVDAFRLHKDISYVLTPPAQDLSDKLTALIASTVETLCEELEVPFPGWSRGTAPLKDPWFVSGFESLKALTILECPIHFRKRNIFVLNNFLSRA